MKKFRKLTCMLVSLLAVSVLFAGCNSDEATSVSAAETSAASSASEAETTEAPVEETTAPAASAAEGSVVEGSVVEGSAVEEVPPEVITCDDVDTYLIESSKAVHEQINAGLSGKCRLLIKADNSAMTFDQYHATKVVVNTVENEYTVLFSNEEDAAAAMDAISQMSGIEYVETDSEVSIAD